MSPFSELMIDSRRKRPFLKSGAAIPLALAAVFGTFSASTLIWAATDLTPPPWDPSDHLRWAYDYYQNLARLDVAGFGREFWSGFHPYAPLVHLITAGFFLVSGASRVAGVFVNLVALAVMMWSVFQIARYVYPSDEPESVTSRLPGFMAAVLAPAYHFSAWLVHDAFLDFPLAAIVALAFALALRTQNFQIRSYSLLLGLIFGLGMWTKLPFLFFFLLPSLLLIPLLARAAANRNWRVLSNLACAALIAAVVTAVWYLPHWSDTIEIIRTNDLNAAVEGEASVWSWSSLFYYVFTLVNLQTQLPFAALFGAGLVQSLARRVERSAVLYLWILSGIGVFTLIANKDPRYTVPVLPAVALISAGVFAYRGFLTFRWRSALAAVVTLWAFVSFFNAQWPAPGPGLSIYGFGARWNLLGRNYFGFDHRPIADTWGIPDAIQAVAQYPKPDVVSRSRPVLGVVVNQPFMNPSAAALYARLLSDRPGPPLVDVDWLVMDSAKSRVETCDFLLVRTNFEGMPAAPLESIAADLIRSDPSRFIPIAAFPLPVSGSSAAVYKCLQ